MPSPYHHGDLRQALTDEARRVVGAIGAGMNRVADSLLAPLAPAERREFLALLKKLEDHARKAT